MAGTLNTVSVITHNTEDFGRRLLVRGNRVFLATGKTDASGAVRSFDVDPNTGTLSDTPGPMLSSAWTGFSGTMSKYFGLLSAFDLASQPKTVVVGEVGTYQRMLTFDTSSGALSSSVINGNFLRSSLGSGGNPWFTCNGSGLVAARGEPEGYGEGRYLSAGNVLTNTVWPDLELNSGNYPNYIMHQSQPYIHVTRVIETSYSGSGAREVSIYDFSGTAAPTLNTYRLDTTGVGTGASLYTNSLQSTAPLTPDPATNMPEFGQCAWQPWPGHPNYLIAFFNRKTPGTTPEVQAWIAFLNVSDPLSWTFETAVLVSGSGKWVLNRNGEVLAHTCWADADGTFAFLRVVEYGVERLLKVHVATGIPHDSWAFTSEHYPSQYTSGPAYGLHGEFVTESGWYGAQYRNELHVLGKINGAPKKFYFPTHWDAILRTGR